jgi:hypothetical protein
VIRKVSAKVFSFPVMLAGVLASWVFVGASTGLWDPDVWFHMRNAAYLLSHGRPVQADLYSYTAQGLPLVDHQWLSEVPYYYAWRAAGLVGIFLLFFLLLVAIHFGMYYRAWRESGNLKASFLVCGLSTFLSSVSFAPRTLLSSYLCLLVLLLVLDRFRATGKAPLWLIPPLFCLWINCHGSWPLGMVVLGLYFASGLVEGSWGRVEAVRWTPRQIRQLLATAAASVAALFINPYTYRLVLYPYEMATRQKLNITYTDEWLSVDFHEPRGKVVLVLLLVLLLGILLTRRNWKSHEVLLAGFAIYSGLTHVRFLFLAAILLTPLLAKMLDVLPPYRPEIDKHWLNATVMGALLILLIHFAPSQEDLNRQLAKRFPTHALAFVKAQGLQGNFYNAYHWGGYMIYVDPKLRTFIDSRADVFEYAGVFKDYLDAEAFHGSLQILEKYHVQYALIPASDPLGYLLKNTGGWKTLYTDEVAVVLERIPSSPPPASTTLSPGVPVNP